MRILHALLTLLKHYLLIFQLFLSLPSLVLGQASSTSWLTSSIPQTQHSLNLIPLRKLLGQFMVLGLSYTDSRFNLWTEGGNIPSFQFCLMMEVSSIPQIVFPEDALRSHFRQQQTSQTLITNKTSLAPLTYIFSTHLAAFPSKIISPSARSVSSSWYRYSRKTLWSFYIYQCSCIWLQTVMTEFLEICHCWSPKGDLENMLLRLNSARYLQFAQVWRIFISHDLCCNHLDIGL